MSPSVADPATEYGADPNIPEMPDYGPNNENLPLQLKRALLAAAKEAQTTGKFMRRQEVLRDAKLRLYDEGIQHVYLNQGYAWTMATPGGSIPSGPNHKNGFFSEYIDDYPIFPAFAQIIRAKLSEHQPSIDFQPDDTNVPADIESAKAAEAMRHDYDRNNDVKMIQQQIVYHWEMGSRAVVWTRSEDCPPRFGDIDGMKQRRVTSTVHGTIEAQVPLFASKLSDYGYCILYDDPEIKEAKAKYPLIADKIESGQMCLDENAWERIARLGIVQTSSGRNASGSGWNIGDAMAHLISRGNIWLRANRLTGKECQMDEPFTEATESDVNPETGMAMTVGQKLTQLFPAGVHMVVLGSELAEAHNQSMDDCLSVSHAYIGKGQARMPIMMPMVVCQDRFNQGMNLIAESQDHLVPSTYFGGTLQEYAAITKQRAKPGAFRHMKDIPSGVRVSDLVYREPDYQIPPSQMQFLEFLDGSLPQFMLSVPPSIWGAAMSDNKLMDVNEPIPTPSGFIRNGDLIDGSTILGEDGKPYEVVKAHPPQTVDAFLVTFDDGTFTCVHGGHLWTTFTRDERIAKHRRSSEFRALARASHKPRGTGLYPQQVKRNVDRGGANYTPVPVLGTVRTTQEIADTLLVGEETSKMGVCVNHTIPLCSPVQLPERRLLIDPYCLGAWLGDGSSNGGGSHFTASDKDGPDVLRHFDAAGYPYKRLQSPNDWSIQGLTTDLKKLNLHCNKHIPEGYLWGSYEQRLSLLQGLMDTDGGCSKNGRAIFGNANRELSEGVYHLAASLGLKPFITTVEVSLNGVECAPSHRVEWAGNVPVFRMERKLKKLKKAYKTSTRCRYITSVTPCGQMEMRCLTTDNPSGLYLFGKNFNVTHNTAAGYQLAASQAMGILGALWDMEVQVFSDIYYQNCIAISNDDDYADQITIPDQKGRRSVVDKSSLTKGKFRCFADKDSGFPESTNSRRQSMERLVALLAPTPLGSQIMGSPDNAAELVRLSGVPLVIPEAIAREKQLREIEILLATEPVIGDPGVLALLRSGASVPDIVAAIQAARNALMANYQAQLQQQQIEHAGATLAAQASGGAPPPPPVPAPPPDPTKIAKSSVPIWPSDYSQWEANKCQDYLSSDQANTELTIGRPSPDPALFGDMIPNTAGVLNVFLHWEAHVAAIPAAPMPAPSGPLPAVGSPPKMAPMPAGS